MLFICPKIYVKALCSILTIKGRQTKWLAAYSQFHLFEPQTLLLGHNNVHWCQLNFETRSSLLVPMQSMGTRTSKKHPVLPYSQQIKRRSPDAIYFSKYACGVVMLIRSALTKSMSQYLIDQIKATTNLEVRTDSSEAKM